MVKIRLRRTGAKKQPSYRVVVTDSRTPRDGRFIEIVGHYNPRTEQDTVDIHEDRVLYWLSVGAQPTDPVKKLLENLGTLERFARLKEGADLEGLLAEAEATREKSGTIAEVEVEEAGDEAESLEIEEEAGDEAESLETEEEVGDEVESLEAESEAEEEAADSEEETSETES